MEFQDIFLEWEMDNPFDATEPARHFQSDEEYEEALQSYNDHRLYSFGKYVYQKTKKPQKVYTKYDAITESIGIVCGTICSIILILALFGVL